MVRAGRGSELIERFRVEKIVAIGWSEVGDLSKLKERNEVLAVSKQHYPDYKAGKLTVTASHLFRFAQVVSEGDRVVSYDSSTRIYIVGTIAGPYRFDKGQEYGHVRPVEWEYEVARDRLSIATKHSLGSIATLFEVSTVAAAELSATASGSAPVSGSSADDEADQHSLLEDVQQRSREFIKDRLNELDWDEMQEVVAGLLRAMGYKTRVSAPGPDRGRDIIASPDGFGFEPPRIVVEVKHRQGAMRSQDIRSFLGGRHKDDKGLYVSTGGFTKDALYEADRASIPVTLLDLDGLVDGLLEHYEKMDTEIRALLPLVKLWWVG